MRQLRPARRGRVGPQDALADLARAAVGQQVHPGPDRDVHALVVPVLGQRAAEEGLALQGDRPARRVLLAVLHVALPCRRGPLPPREQYDHPPLIVQGAPGTALEAKVPMSGLRSAIHTGSVLRYGPERPRRGGPPGQDHAEKAHGRDVHGRAPQADGADPEELDVDEIQHHGGAGARHHQPGAVDPAAASARPRARSGPSSRRPTPDRGRPAGRRARPTTSSSSPACS